MRKFGRLTIALGALWIAAAIYNNATTAFEGLRFSDLWTPRNIFEAIMALTIFRLAGEIEDLQREFQGLYADCDRDLGWSARESAIPQQPKIDV